MEVKSFFNKIISRFKKPEVKNKKNKNGKTKKAVTPTAKPFIKRKFLDQITFYKRFLSGINKDKRVIIRFTIFMIMALGTVAFLNQAMFLNNALVTQSSTILISFIKMFIMFSPVLFYKFYTENKIKKLKFINPLSYLKLMCFAFFSTIILILAICFPLILLNITTNFSNIEAQNSAEMLVEAKKILLGFSFIEWCKVVLLLSLSLLLSLISVFAIPFTYFNMKHTKNGFFSSLGKSYKAIIKNLKFTIIPMILFVLFAILFTQIHTEIQLISGMLGIIIGVVSTAIFIALSSYYIFSLYLMLFFKNGRLKPIK